MHGFTLTVRLITYKGIYLTCLRKQLMLVNLQVQPAAHYAILFLTIALSYSI